MKKFLLLLTWTIFASINSAIGQCPSGDVEFSTQSEIDQFKRNYPNCTIINGNLSLTGVIDNLSGLSNIESVAKTLTIRVFSFGTTDKELSLPNLTSVGTDFTCFQSDLKALRLNKLTTIGGNVKIFQNDIQTIGFNSLDTIGGYLDFFQNGLSSRFIESPPPPPIDVNFNQLRFVGETMSFYQNYIGSISCTSMETIQRNLEIYQNDSLTNIFFDRLSTVSDSLYIYSTDIVDVNTFQRLTKVGGVFQLHANASLADCSGLCPLLSAEGVAGNISLVNNSSGCNSAASIIASCSDNPPPSISCYFPSGLTATNIGYSSIQLQWESESETNYYQTRIRFNNGDWEEQNFHTDTTATWVQLAPCTIYEVQVRGGCVDQDENIIGSGYSSSIFVTTDGCGDAYCASYGNPWDNWIEKIMMDTLDNKSGNDLGHGHYPHLSTALEREKTYDLFIEPGYSTTPKDQVYYSVWIDFNQDNDFDDNGEQILTIQHDNNEMLQVPITIPSTAKLGSTRMRISSNKEQAPTSCGITSTGEVEDYTVIIQIPTLEVNATHIDLPATEGTVTLSVTSNVSWVAQSDVPWISFSPSSGVNDGTITIIYETNTETTGQTATITITSDRGLTKMVLVNQAGVSSLSNRPITYVNQLATGKNNGSSWADAYVNLQVALSSTKTGEIWVATGTHLPTHTQDRGISFELHPSVPLFGGFAATGNPTWEDRDWEKYPTILSGDIGEKGNINDNSSHVVYLNERSTFNTTVDGFTISGGNAGYAGGGADIGSAFNPRSVFTFKNCLFRDNRSEYEGGAIDCGWINLIVEDCKFENNYADYEGGAISYFSGHEPTRLAQLHILNCMFTNNSADYEGGAIDASGLSRIVGCLFLENTANYEAGAISHSRGDSLLVTNCTFAFNIAERGAAAISNFSWDSTFTLITNSVFYGNAAGNNRLFDFSGGKVYAAIAYSSIDDDSCPSNIECGEGMIFDYDSPFVDVDSDDFRPREGGVLINNGKKDYLVPILSNDLAGNPRITDELIDIGAYEAMMSGSTSNIDLALPINTITFFPNPTTEHAIIQLKEQASSDLTGTIINQAGQIMQQFIIRKGQASLGVSLLTYPAGMYWLELEGEDLLVASVPLIVVR